MLPIVDAGFVWLAAFADGLARLRPETDPQALLAQAKEALMQFGATWTPGEAAHLWIVPGDPGQDAADDVNY